MPKQVPIKVFLIGRTQVEREAVERWLEFIGVEGFELPEQEAVTDPSLLIALAAKRCYKSFKVDPSLNPNVTRVRQDYVEYLDNILKVGHGCYDSDTEVLTSEGWKSFPDVDGTEKFATRCTQSGEVSYVNAVGVTHAPYSGDMYRVDATGVDLLVTPNHQMFVCPTTTKAGRKRENSSYKLVQASQLGHISHAYVKSGKYSGKVCLEPEVMALLGFVIGDGHYASGNKCRFRLRKPRKITWLRSVMRRLRAFDPAYQLAEGGEDSDRFTVSFPETFKVWLSEIYDDFGEKVIPQELLATATYESQYALFEGLMQSDGSVCGTGQLFDTTSRKLADQFQQLCLHVGLAANESQAECYKNREGSLGDKPIIRLHILQRTLRPQVNKFSGQKGKTSWVSGWEGDVHCVTLPDDTDHTLYVRRNGKPVWCGNSVLEHSVYNLAIENVSRVFTSEMNRHRAGWAISEGSLRFIRFGEEIPYWCPDSIAGEDVWTEADAADVVGEVIEQADRRADGTFYLDDDKLHYELCNQMHEVSQCDPSLQNEEHLLTVKKQLSREVFAQAFGSQERAYRVLQAIWKDELAPESGFAGKKQVTSMMRRIVGLGVATGGVWSGNIRALRHVFAMRASEHAEEEMVHVFSRVIMTMAEREPALFGDFYQDENGFWRPKYVKI